MSIESVPYPTREISDNLPLFLSDIGAVPVPVRVTGTQPIVATKGATYITYGSGTITFTDPDILTSVSGDHYKVIVGGTSVAVIGGVTYNKVSPIEILRLVSAGAWITHSGLDASQISSGIIDAARLPSYVDDVLEFANLAAFPAEGELGKIYVALDKNEIYRWSSSAYIKVSNLNTLTPITLGLNNTAAGTNASAVGYTNVASGDNSSAVGRSNIASAGNAIALGNSNDATAGWSSAVGFDNSATATSSTAVGYVNVASGSSSSALGYSNTASNTNASAVGRSNAASGVASTALGYENTASGEASSSFGTTNTVSAINGVAVGNSNRVKSTGLGSVAFGVLNNVSGATLNETTGVISGTLADITTHGKFSTAVGLRNTTSGDFACAVGYSNSTGRAQVETATIVAASGATVAGTLNVTVTSNLFSSTTVPVALLTSDNTADLVATKVRTALSLNANIAAWYNVGGTGATYTLTTKYFAANDTTLNMAHAKVSPLAGITDAATSVNTVGGLASGVNSSAVGYTNIASGTDSAAFGSTNIASGTNSAAVGRSNTASNTNASAVGRSNMASGVDSTALGYSNAASDSACTAVGWDNDATVAGACAFGTGNLAEAQDSSAVGYSNGVSAISSSAFGWDNSVSATGATGASAFGATNVANGISSSAFGNDNDTTGQYSSAFGYGNTAIGNYSSAFGNGVRTSVNYTQEFGIHSAGARLSSVRIHDDGYVALSLRDSATALTDGGATVGAEADGTLMRGAYAIRRNGSNLFIDANSSAGTITSSGLVTKLTSSEYTVTNGPTPAVKTFNASTATIDDVYNVLATLIQTLITRQII